MVKQTYVQILQGYDPDLNFGQESEDLIRSIESIKRDNPVETRDFSERPYSPVIEKPRSLDISPDFVC